MNLFRYDSPAMEFMGKVADMIILNILWFLCSLPVITVGAATTAKYAGSMRIIRNEESPVFKAFFKDFKENFKQATVIWLGLMVVIAICALDWIWIWNKGFANVSKYYIIAILVLSIMVLGIYLTVFPFIARFTVTTKEAIKASAIFSFLHFIKIALIGLLVVGTVVACVWYMKWLIAIGLFGTTTAFYFNTILLLKDFKKMEDNFEKMQGAADGKPTAEEALEANATAEETTENEEA